MKRNLRCTVTQYVLRFNKVDFLKKNTFFNEIAEKKLNESYAVKILEINKYISDIF